MGQYYIIVFLNDKDEVIHWISPCGAKLTEHGYIGNEYCDVVEYLLSPLGPCYKSRVVWAGDYADPEEHRITENKEGYEEKEQRNLYDICMEDFTNLQYSTPHRSETRLCNYIVNHTNKEYVDKRKTITLGGDSGLHPLAVLTADGNGRGGGDIDSDSDTIGAWVRHVISVEREVPWSYRELLMHDPMEEPAEESSEV
jgi:hypothetical protein